MLVTRALRRALLYLVAALALLWCLSRARQTASHDAVRRCSVLCDGTRLDYTGNRPSSWIRGDYLTLKTVGQVKIVDGEIVYTPGTVPVDVVFNSAVDPRDEWTVLPTPLRTSGTVPVFLTVKSGERVHRDTRPEIRMEDGKLKILQLADLHLSSFDGVCRDQYPQISDECKADERTMVFVNKLLDIEKPDLVIFTGDQVFGEDSFHVQSTVLKLVAPLIDRNIPYAAMFGNHDDEGSMTREELCAFFETLPMSLVERGPSDIDGVGNYVLSIPRDDPKLTIYIMDSHKYSPKPRQLPGYDWIKENQLEWIKQRHQELGNTDLSMAFFHIPLPEYTNLAQGYVGNFKEGITAPKYNSGARDVLQSLGVSVVSVGHDHCNDYCLKDVKEDEGIWLCYGGGGGEGGYGGYGGTTRRARVYEIDGKTITTWKRLETTLELFDRQVLVREGTPV